MWGARDLKVRRSPQVRANRENPGVHRTSGRAATVRERWLSAWPQTLPYGRGSDWGLTFVHFCVAHPMWGICLTPVIALASALWGGPPGPPRAPPPPCRAGPGAGAG